MNIKILTFFTVPQAIKDAFVCSICLDLIVYLQLDFYKSNNIEMSNYEQKRKRISLGSKKKRCLSDFESLHPQQVFENAHLQYPVEILKIPLASEYKIKVFRNRNHWHQQIFTYVTLVLCFESGNTLDDSICLALVDSLYELIQKQQFQLMMPQTSSQLLNHTQLNLKNILSQYLNLMNEKKMSVLKSLSKYPLVIEIFVSFFRTLICLGQQCSTYDEQLQMANVYDFLSSYFQIQMVMTQSYIYFTEANIYVAQLSLNQVYMFIPHCHEQISSFLNEKQVIHTHKSGISSVHQLMQSEEIKLKSAITKPNKNSKWKKKVKISFQKTSKNIVYDSLENGGQNENDLYADCFKTKKINQNSRMSLNQTQSQYNFSQKHIKNENQISYVELEEEAQQIKEEASLAKLKKQKLKYLKHYRNRSQLCPIATQAKQNILCFRQTQSRKIIKERSLDVSEYFSHQGQIKHQRRPCLKEHNQRRSSGLFYKPVENNGLKKLQMLAKMIPESAANVSKQFTNSFILEAIQQPYKSKIRATKQRAKLGKKHKVNLLSTNN